MGNSSCGEEMTLCPECVQHVRHCEGASSVECPFCDHSFSPSEPEHKRPSASMVPPKLKTGVMAASFAGATLLAGCGDPSGPEPTPQYGAPPPEDAGYNQDRDVDDGDEADADHNDQTADAGDNDESDASDGDD